MIDRIDDIDLLDPVERDHPHLVGSLGWWLPLPNLHGSTKIWDVIGGHHGTGTNRPTWRNSEGRFAASYSAWNSQRHVVTSNDFNFTAGNYTISFSFNSTNVNNFSCPLSRGIWNSHGWYTQFLNNRVRLVINRPNGLVCDNASALSVNTWYNIAFSRMGGILNIYLNGQDDGTVGAADIRTSSAVLYFGGYTGVETFWYNGMLDNVHIWNRHIPLHEWQSYYSQYTHGFPDLLRREKRLAYSLPPTPPPAITRRPFFSDWGSLC